VEKQNVIIFDMANNYGDPSKWKESKKKPTEAFTTKGTAAKDLAKSKAKNRFSSDAKTKVKGATDAFAGSGTPLGTSMGVNPLNKSQIAGALLTAAAGGELSARNLARTPASSRTLNVPPAPRQFPRPSLPPQPPQPPLNVPRAPGSPAPRPSFATKRRPKK
jgi:hypothetical protein